MTRIQGSIQAALAVAAMAGTLAVASCGRNGTTGEPGAGDSAATATPGPTTEERVALGAHLVVVTGCNDCHTPGGLYGAPDASRTLAGSELGWMGPWGTTYASNLTPDVETGIGSWNEEQIVAALRTGQRPDGTPILPPMPWPNFARLTDEEAYALAAYLKSLPPVRHAKPANLPPGAKAAGPVIAIPAPGAWDAPKVTPGSTGGS
jgi:mono/diheme cytochrome c family protein